MRRYALLFAAVLVVGALLALTRVPRGTSGPAAPAAEAPVAVITLTVEEGGVRPARVDVALGTRVRITLENRTSRAAVVALAGYEDRLAIGAVEPRASWTGEFTADRPGEDFAWLVNGEPAGTVGVRGEHLVEGHR